MFCNVPYLLFSGGKAQEFEKFFKIPQYGENNDNNNSYSESSTHRSVFQGGPVIYIYIKDCELYCLYPIVKSWRVCPERPYLQLEHISLSNTRQFYWSTVETVGDELDNMLVLEDLVVPTALLRGKAANFGKKLSHILSSSSKFTIVDSIACVWNLILTRKLPIISDFPN